MTLRIAAFSLLLSVPASVRCAEPIDFEKSVRPILQKHCVACHGAKRTESGLRLDRAKRALAGGDQDVAIVPGKPDESPLLMRLRSTGDDQMPPEGPRVSDHDIAVLSTWIKSGAVWPADSDEDPAYAAHWSWEMLNQPELPQSTEWDTNFVDVIVRQKLQGQGFQPAEAAERSTLIRRAYLDVTGLPPAPVEWEKWTTDGNGNWYERMVDSLLKSPHYGEHWGRLWLDQARYADSDGYEKDRPRPSAYLYRDWVIDSLNQNMPFDQFSIQQIAGDLLPEATPRMIAATGFHRNTLTNNEGGIDREEDRVKQTVDRLNTTFTVWMGLTVQCAQCHSHKYDPISQQEYYELYAFFNDADESTQVLDPSDEQRRAVDAAKAGWSARVAQLEQKVESAKAEIRTHQKQREQELRQRFPDGRPSPPTSGLKALLTFDGADPLAVTGAPESAARFHGPGTLAVGRDAADDSRVGVSFDGSGQHIQLDGVPRFNADQPFTCSLWIRPEDNLGGLITLIDEPNRFRGIDFTNNRGLLEVHLVDTWPVNAIKVTPTSARLRTGEWQHVLFSYDGSRKAAGVTICINGKQAQLKVHFDNLTGDFATEEPWRIGRRKAGTFLKGKLDDVRIYDRILSEAEIARVMGDNARLAAALRLIAVDLEERTEEQEDQLLDYFVFADQQAYSLQSELKTVRENPPQVERSTAMVMKQRSTPRETFIHKRGEFLNKGRRVGIGTPDFLPPMKPRGDRPDRLDLAHWMFGPGSSLTARVAVNRIWQAYFGTGLVRTDADFGTQGERPSHPELLDALAIQLRDSGWDLRALHRTILTSSTYRQSSRFRSGLNDRDPNNRLLGVQKRIRVSAETVRDLALSVSGLLDPKVKGPSVYPPLPAGVIELAFVDVINRGPWKVSEGRDRYRRGLYTFFQRTSPYPMLSLFDAPDSNVTCTRRERSNTPLQALTLWNDPVFAEAAAHLASRILNAEVDDPASVTHRIQHAFVLCFARKPSPEEIRAVESLLRESERIYKADLEAAKKVVGETSGAPDHALSLRAAWVSVARTLMNLDEFITRP